MCYNGGNRVLRPREDLRSGRISRGRLSCWERSARLRLRTRQHPTFPQKGHKLFLISAMFPGSPWAPSLLPRAWLPRLIDILEDGVSAYEATTRADAISEVVLQRLSVTAKAATRAACRFARGQSSGRAGGAIHRGECSTVVRFSLWLLVSQRAGNSKSRVIGAFSSRQTRW